MPQDVQKCIVFSSSSLGAVKARLPPGSRGGLYPPGQVGGKQGTPAGVRKPEQVRSKTAKVAFRNLRSSGAISTRTTATCFL